MPYGLFMPDILPRARETFDGHAFKSKRRQECAQMPRQNGQIRHSNAARTAWNAASHPHRASALHPVQETAITPVCSGLIRGIPVDKPTIDGLILWLLSSRHSLSFDLGSAWPV